MKVILENIFDEVTDFNRSSIVFYLWNSIVERIPVLLEIHQINFNYCQNILQRIVCALQYSSRKGNSAFTAKLEIFR